MKAAESREYHIHPLNLLHPHTFTTPLPGVIVNVRSYQRCIVRPILPADTL